MQTKIGIIGFGNMGQAFFAAVKSSYPKIYFFIYDKIVKPIVDPKATFCPNAETLIKHSEIILLAVKPQDFMALAESVQNDFKNKLIISIMAGVKINKITALTGCQRIVRAMPNIGVKNGNGVIGWKATEQISQKEKTNIRNIFASAGLEIELENEEQLNSITALSGSGPAYFYHLGCAMVSSAEKLGFSKEMAEKIIQNTFFGSAAILQSEKMTLSEIEKIICSKGGTTEAALNCFKQNNFSKIIDEGIDAAKNRAEDLAV